MKKRLPVFLLILFFLSRGISICAQPGLRACYDKIREDSLAKDFRSAFDDLKKYAALKDSLNDLEKKKKETAAKLNYKFGKKFAADSVKNLKDREISNQKLIGQNARIAQEKTLRYALYSGIIFVLLFSGFLFNRFRVIRQQKKLIEFQKTVVEEKQKEILDSIYYARRIQQALLTSEKYIAKNLSRLNQPER